MNIKTLLVILALASLACQSAGTIATITPTSAEQAIIQPATIHEPTETPEPQCAQAITPLHVRANTSESAAVLFILAEGQRVDVLSKAGAWSLVRAGERTGFAKTEFLAECNR